jgi:hypothetical protein
LYHNEIFIHVFIFSLSYSLPSAASAICAPAVDWARIKFGII